MVIRMTAITVILGIVLAVSTQAASDIVTQVEQTYAQAKDLQANFTQNTFIEILDREERRSGKIYFGKNRFRIEYHQPVPQTYIYNGETLWIYSPKYKEVEIYSDAADRISREALTFLSGLGKLRESFRVPKTRKEGKQTRITLIPKANDSRIKELELVVDSKSCQIEEARLWPKQGNRSHYIFSEMNTDSTLPDKLFNFKPPKNVSVIRPDR